MQSERCAVADFQQAMAYAADGLHSSMLRSTAPGDANREPQSIEASCWAVTWNPLAA